MIYRDLVERIDARAMAYIQTHANRTVAVGSAVFDRQRQVLALSERAQSLLSSC
jgi:cobalt-precorrin-5B (C1)-methyltransferase